MLLTISLVSIIILVIVLWIFSRLAWGGGMRPPSYDLLKPASPQPGLPAQLPEADQELLEVRCTQCSFSRLIPELAQLPASLGSMVGAMLKNPIMHKTCPECGGQLQVFSNRTITHTSGGASLTFSTLRSGTTLLITINGTAYSSLAEIDDPQNRRLVAEALNISEDLMIIRGTNEEIQINRSGHLAPGQLERLRSLTPFRLPALPGLIVGVIMLIYGAMRQDVPGWIILGLGLYLALNSWLRYRQQTRLKAGEIRSFVGVLERSKSSPMAAFEAEVTIGGQNYVLLSHGGDAPMRNGVRYRCYVVDGISRMGIIVAMEDA